MNPYYPSYYKSFQCTASKCSDSCCIGWEVDIDEKALERFKLLESSSDLSICDHIDTNGEMAHFVLEKDGRCPFLNDDNLCEIIIKHGESSLCDICHLHPRFINDYESFTEYGLDLCCEEAARLILSEETIYPNCLTVSSHIDSDFLEALIICRANIFHELGNASNSLNYLMESLIKYSDQLDDLIFDQDYDKMKTVHLCVDSSSQPCLPTWDRKSLTESLEFLISLTPLSHEWHCFLEEALKQIDHIIDKRDEYTKKHPEAILWSRRLLGHYIYHYFLESVWEDATDANTYLAIFFVTMIQFLATAVYVKKGTFTIDDQIRICVQMSKEVEYSAENLDKTLDFCVNSF